MKTRYLPLLLALFAAGCIKDGPGPEVPPVPAKPQWLISRITMLHRTGSPDPLPGEPGQHLLKQVFELHYNDYYKPVSRYVYSADGDTSNLQLASRDSLLYDAQYRMVQADVYPAVANTVLQRRTFAYSGSDTLPASMEIWYSRSDTLYSSGTVHYEYRQDTTIATGLDYHGGPDTTWYVYVGGNFRKLISSAGYEEELYTQYDNSPSLERLMNLQHGLAFRLPMDYVSLALPSRNNWIGTGPQLWEKTVFAYAMGGTLISEYVIMEPYPNPSYWTFNIEYFTP